MSFPRAAIFHCIPASSAVRVVSRLLCLFIICAAFHSSADSQTAPDADEDIIRVRTDLVTLPLTVTDSRGQRVAGLQQTDFAIFDGGQPVAIHYFGNAAARVSLLFAVDTSGSTRDIISRQKEAALALLTRFGDNSRIGLLTFADQQVFALPFTEQLEQARAAFSFSTQPNRPTAIFDAALAAARSFNAPTNRRVPERRIVILLSDGLDTASATRAAEAISAARKANVSFYVIHLPLYTERDGRLDIRRPAKGFRDLATKTGGRYFLLGDKRNALNPRSTFDLNPIFNAIAEDLHSQYVLGYYLDDTTRAQGEHHIEVKLTSPDHRRKLRVQSLREGYKLP
ncbi:hypothetical protein BH18ACI2_BH18ACI2_28040 [soil metagenome]